MHPITDSSSQQIFVRYPNVPGTVQTLRDMVMIKSGKSLLSKERQIISKHINDIISDIKCFAGTPR